MGRVAGTAGRRRRGLLLFKDGYASFVGEDGVFEAAEVGGPGGRDLDLADDVLALVVEETAFDRGRGVIAGEVEVDVGGVGEFIDDVTGRKGDVELKPATSAGSSSRATSRRPTTNSKIASAPI